MKITCLKIIRMLLGVAVLAAASPLQAGMGAVIARVRGRIQRFLVPDHAAPSANRPLQPAAGLPPAAPADLRITGRSGIALDLAWEAAMPAPERTIARYELRRNGVTIARPTGTRATVVCNPTGLEPESFTVVAIDDQGMVSVESMPVVTVHGVPVPMTLERRTAFARISAYDENPEDGGPMERSRSDAAMNSAAEAALAEATAHLSELEWGEAYGPDPESFLFGPMGFALATRLYEGTEGEHVEQVLSQAEYRFRIGGASSGPAGPGWFGGWPVDPAAEMPSGATVPVRWAEVLESFEGESEVLAVREAELLLTTEGAVGPVCFVSEPGRAGMVNVRLLPGLGGLLARTAAGSIATTSAAGVLTTGQSAALDLLDPVGTDYLSPWQSWAMVVTVEGPPGVVKIVAIDPDIEGAQGWEAALAEGIEIPSGAPLAGGMAPDGRSLAGRRLTVVALQPGVVHLLVGAAGAPETNLKRKITVLPAIQLAVDANRDGIVNLAGESVMDEVTAADPFRFWVNDDADTGGLDDDDIPLGAAPTANFQDGLINSARDLVDFFPVYLDLAGALAVLRGGAPVTVRLKQADGAVDFAYTAQTLTGAEAHWRTLPKRGYGDAFDREPGEAETHLVTPEGVELSPAFLNGVRDLGWGVLLFEGRSPTVQPLVLELEQGGELMATAQLPLRLSNVEEMFRQVDLTGVPVEYDGTPPPLPEKAPPNRMGDPGEAWPDKLTNGNYFVFVHGYSVDSQQARGWQSEMFKRVHVLGSRTRFVGITWHGATGLHVMGGYLDYHKSVFHALQTGDALKQALEFTAGAKVTVAAHSLGNGVVAQAIQFKEFRPEHFVMFNAALPIEAFSPSSVTAEEAESMVEEKWVGFDPKLRAAEWNRLFTAPDERRNLTWTGRYADVLNRTDLHHFYSTGEDVLANNLDARSASVIELLVRQEGNVTLGSWKLQELVKGVETSRSLGGLLLARGQAGWGFSSHWLVSSSGGHNYGVSPRVLTPDEAKNVFGKTEVLRIQPFFDRFLEPKLMSDNSVEASDTAKRPFVIYDLLARAIPSKSYAAAANAMAAQVLDNFDMQAKGVVSGEAFPSGHKSWTHSDIKALALPLSFPVYDELISKGALR
jgi:hypothetical protein